MTVCESETGGYRKEPLLEDLARGVHAAGLDLARLAPPAGLEIAAQAQKDSQERKTR
jgi:hypothetical protein